MEHKEDFLSTISHVSYTMSCFQYRFFPFIWMIWLTSCLHFGLRSVLFWGKLTIAIKIRIIISHNKWPWGLWLQGWLLDQSINGPGFLSFLLWCSRVSWLQLRVELWPPVFTQQHPLQGTREKETTVFLCRIDLVFICQDYFIIWVLHFDLVD